MKMYVLIMMLAVITLSACTLQTGTKEPIDCPGDVFQCPDGLYVSRDPDNNCSFHLCATQKRVLDCAADVKQCPDGKYVNRDPMNNCAFKYCGQSTSCPADVFKCADGKSVYRNPNAACNFYPCPGKEIPCTEEVQLCPDKKTYVSRNPMNNCVFDDCPGMKNAY